MIYCGLGYIVQDHVAPHKGAAEPQLLSLEDLVYGQHMCCEGAKSSLCAALKTVRMSRYSSAHPCRIIEMLVIWFLILWPFVQDHVAPHKGAAELRLRRLGDLVNG